jgi:hypothetical protein
MIELKESIDIDAEEDKQTLNELKKLQNHERI